MSSTIATLRPATPREYPTIQLIAHATWPSAYGDILTPEQIDYMLAMMYTPEAVASQVASGQAFYVLETVDMRLHENACDMPISSALKRRGQRCPRLAICSW